MLNVQQEFITTPSSQSWPYKFPSGAPWDLQKNSHSNTLSIMLSPSNIMVPLLGCWILLLFKQQVKDYKVQYWLKIEDKSTITAAFFGCNLETPLPPNTTSQLHYWIWHFPVTDFQLLPSRTQVNMTKAFSLCLSRTIWEKAKQPQVHQNQETAKKQLISGTAQGIIHIPPPISAQQFL